MNLWETVELPINLKMETYNWSGEIGVGARILKMG
jgi:hypothetical protein